MEMYSVCVFKSQRDKIITTLPHFKIQIVPLLSRSVQTETVHAFMQVAHQLKHLLTSRDIVEAPYADSGFAVTHDTHHINI